MDSGETVESQISTWSQQRPGWQRDVLQRLLAGRSFSEQELEGIADDLIAGRGESEGAPDEIEIPPAGKDKPTISLEAISDITNVNALPTGARLTFGTTGLTVVYGNNASGKSGYARIIKSVSGALDKEPVLPNVFDNSHVGQQAKLAFHRDDTADTATWPGEVEHDLQAIRFYDEACGNTYISRDSELSYRPSALALLDGLVAVCDAVHSILDKRLAENREAQKKVPTPAEDSASAAFLDSLSSSTTYEEVDNACQVPDDVDQQLRMLREKEVRLGGSDPATERKRLRTLADKADALSLHIEKLSSALSDEAIAKAVAAQSASAETRAAAEFASDKAFQHEPVTGVGTETWRAMWEAAREFSLTAAYHDHEFPVVEAEARCVLCQQILSEDASERLVRFETFVQDKTTQLAAKADEAFEAIHRNLDGLDVKSAEIAVDLVTLESADKQLSEQATTWLDSADQRRQTVVVQIGGHAEEEVPPLESDPRKKLDTFANKQRAAASAIDTTKFTDSLQEITQERIDLEGRVTLAKGKKAIVAEVIRLRSRGAIEAARNQTDTASITRKSSEIMNRSVTNEVRERFKAESERLQLDHVELKATGGRKGKFQQRPSLLGAEAPPPLPRVLSEGEQTALGLVGLFTEAHFDGSQSTLVFDDPVTSLDHIRRAIVADRIVEFSKLRQVIVFTHDVTFVIELARSAEAARLDVTERRIERVGGTSPGSVGDAFPWKARDVKQRLGTLATDLAVIRKQRSDWTQEEYEKHCREWAGRLSETWERLIRFEVVDRVFDMAKFEVRPMLFRILPRISDQDNREFQESYGRVSKWAPRHDKSPDFNYVAPEPSDLEQELELVRDWSQRIKSYQQP